MMNATAAIEEWRALLGTSRVMDGDKVLETYGADVGGSVRGIPAALLIDDSEQLPAVMRIASKHRVPVHPISTGKNWGYGTSLPVQNGCTLLDLSRLRKILHFDADFGVVTLEPGVTQGQLAEFLENGGHPYMVPVTGAGPQCSLIGNALERGYGITPHADHFGAVTDLEAILADGTRYRTALREAGGEDLARLFKWGIGPYSSGLFTQGSFGIVTKMTIILARRPECVNVCLFSLKNDALLEAAVERIRTILIKLSGTVGGINLMNRHRVLAMSSPFPADKLDDNGTIPEAVVEEMGRQYRVFPWTGFGTLYGTSRMVAAAKAEVRIALRGVASQVLFLNANNAAMLAALARYVPGKAGRRLSRTTGMLANSLQLVAGHPNETALQLAYWRGNVSQKGVLKDPAADGCGLVWYAPLVPMRPAAVRAYVDMITSITRRHGIEPLLTLTSISDRLFASTVPLTFDRKSARAGEAAHACYAELLSRGHTLGVFPYRFGIEGMSTLTAMQNDASAFHDRLHIGLDPNRLIAPGRYQ